MECELPQLLLKRPALADVAKTKRKSPHCRILREVAADRL
jgi:hypothetical protein